MILNLSLRGRFILAAGFAILLIVVLTLVAMRAILTHTVTQNLDARIDTQIGLLEQAVDAHGELQQGNIHLMPHFENAPLQWGWTISGAGRHWAGGQALSQTGTIWQAASAAAAIVSGAGRSVSGVAMHVRRRAVSLHGRAYVIIVGAPQQLLVEPMEAATEPMEIAMACITLVLLLLAYLQVRYSLQPVLALRDAVVEVREGRASRLSLHQPRELAPLAAELNALIEQNAAGLEHARHHVANLAHGLKTPLATLTLRHAREGASQESRDLVAEMGRRIDHHLNRARSAARTVGERAVADLGVVTQALAHALVHLHEARKVELDICPSVAGRMSVDPEDLDEMLGNLLDNAFLHAAGRVSMSAHVQGSMAIVDIEDDGPGIPPDAVAKALAFGTRLNEQGSGYGLGLGIVRELAELYGGTLELNASSRLGGLRVSLSVPRQK